MKRVNINIEKEISSCGECPYYFEINNQGIITRCCHEVEPVSEEDRGQIIFSKDNNTRFADNCPYRDKSEITFGYSVFGTTKMTELTKLFSDNNYCYKEAYEKAREILNIT